tara:strand:- start:1902 stop:2777 length:876 start_codon:yes stop_codon:yes gene_type:complete
MDSLDLDLDNYELPDLLNLFKLDYNFKTEDLKQAKRMVLMTHPDKSQLPKEYFLFFSKAYKIIYSIYEFRTRGDTKRSTTYSIEKGEDNEELLRKISKKPNFNKIFNELFEKNRIIDEEEEKGYGDWLKSDEGVDNRSTTLTDMHSNFNNKKAEIRAIIHKKDIEETGARGSHEGYSNLGGEIPENYGSGLFSKLTYEDVRKAHIESVVPVTEADMREDYKNVQTLRIQRTLDEKKNLPLSLEQGNKYLQERQGKQDKADVRRAFRLARQDEEVRKANENWMSGFKQITNL